MLKSYVIRSNLPKIVPKFFSTQRNLDEELTKINNYKAMFNKQYEICQHSWAHQVGAFMFGITTGSSGMLAAPMGCLLILPLGIFGYHSYFTLLTTYKVKKVLR
jgi:hypothetical protein